MRYPVDAIALVCYQANRGLQAAQGDELTEELWAGATPGERESYRHGVSYALGRAPSPGEQHEEWYSWHYERGWRYGVYDPEALTHPAMLHWDDPALGDAFRDRGRLFLATVTFLATI
jgi:hypothetical protein